MSSVIISGDTSGAITLSAPAVAGTNTLTLPATTGTVLVNTTVGVCRAWVNFNGTGTPAIRASFNVSSITDVATGRYTLNFTTAVSDANYSAVGSAGQGDAASRPIVVTNDTANTASGCSVAVMNVAATLGDYVYVSVAIFR